MSSAPLLLATHSTPRSASVKLRPHDPGNPGPLPPHADDAAVPAHQGGAAPPAAVLPHGRFLRAVLRRRPAGGEAAGHHPDHPGPVGGGADSHGGRARARGGELPGPPGAAGRVGGHLRADRRSRRLQGAGGAPGGARGHPRHRQRRGPAGGAPGQPAGGAGRPRRALRPGEPGHHQRPLPGAGGGGPGGAARRAGAAAARRAAGGRGAGVRFPGAALPPHPPAALVLRPADRHPGALRPVRHPRPGPLRLRPPAPGGGRGRLSAAVRQGHPAQRPAPHPRPAHRVPGGERHSRRGHPPQPGAHGQPLGGARAHPAGSAGPDRHPHGLAAAGPLAAAPAARPHHAAPAPARRRHPARGAPPRGDRPAAAGHRRRGADSGAGGPALGAATGSRPAAPSAGHAARAEYGPGRAGLPPAGGARRRDRAPAGAA